MKNRVLCPKCIEDKALYKDYTPLENIEELIANITDCDKITK